MVSTTGLPPTVTYQAGRIPAVQVRKGPYIFAVKTHDLVAGRMKTALANFRVY